jgi:hypothetical protein
VLFVQTERDHDNNRLSIGEPDNLHDQLELCHLICRNAGYDWDGTLIVSEPKPSRLDFGASDRARQMSLKTRFQTSSSVIDQDEDAEAIEKKHQHSTIQEVNGTNFLVLAHSR